MRWVALALNRVLVRPAYDKRATRIREATVEERPIQGGTVRMSPCWAIASLPMASWTKTGWPCRITGMRDGGFLPPPVRRDAM